MKDKEFAIKKNLLDLKHSENLSRGITEISIATGGFISVILAIYDKNLRVAIAVACIFALIFLVDGINKFNECKTNREEISKLGLEYLGAG